MNRQLAARSGAFSFPELLLVLGIIAVLCALLIPTLATAKRDARHAQCLRNLKEIGLAYHNFAHDHKNLFPMQVSTQSGGSLEYYLEAKNSTREYYSAFRHFQPIAQNLKSLKVLLCPEDNRVESDSLTNLSNANISYFIAPAAMYSQPDSILLGDRNLSRIGAGLESAIILSRQTVEWNGEMHNGYGNLLFGDGHVNTADNSQLQNILLKSVGTMICPPVIPATDNSSLDGSCVPKPSRWSTPHVSTAAH
jgi:prepilin-type processing-associated H-X9-DG protein